MDELAAAIAARLDSTPPHLVGISGAVCVGKSTTARMLRDAFEDRRVQVLSTDAFLLPNAALADRGLSYRKGVPESFDVAALVSCIHALKRGERVEVPVYSHEVYDIVADERTVFEDPDLVIVEGVIVLDASVAEQLHVAVYIDADEPVVREWFVRRFAVLIAEADESSFYRRFSALGAGEIRSLAQATWDGINGVNLREHILPSRSRATIVVEKGPAHEILRITGR